MIRFVHLKIFGEKRGIIGELAYGLAEEFENEIRFFESKPDELEDIVIESDFEKKLKASMSIKRDEFDYHETPKVKHKSLGLKL